MHRHELKSKGRDTKDWATKSHGKAQSSRAERWNGTASQRTGMLRKGIAGRSKGIALEARTSKGNEVRRIDTQVRSEEGRAPKSKNKNEKEKATCRKSK